MRRHGFYEVLGSISKIVIALVVLLLLGGVVGGLINKGEKSTSETESMGGSGVGTQCWTFCGGKRADSFDVQKNSKCIIFSCDADGQSYTYTCTEDNSGTKCLSACNNDKQIPAACKPDCANVVSTRNCKDVLAEMEAGGYVGGGGAGGGAGGGGAGGGGGGGGGGSGSIVLLQDGKVVSTPKYGVPTEVKIGTNPPKDFQITLKDSSGFDEACDSSGSLRCTYASLPFEFWTNPPALPDGTYKLKIDATTSSDTKLTTTKTISWTCPKITIDPAYPFGPNNVMLVSFESPVLDVNNIRIILNGRDDTVTEKTVSGTNKFSFKLPPLEGNGVSNGVKVGENTLRIERNNEGLCMKYSEALGGYIIINFIEKTYTWSCEKAPATICRTDGGKEYVMSRSSSGNYIDPQTGCRYATGPECTNGCLDGACKEPLLFIESVKLEGVKAGAAKFYEDYYADRFFTITIKNTGTFTAKDVLTGMTVTLGGKVLTQFSDTTFTLSNPLIDAPEISNNLANLNPDQSAEYFFGLKKTCTDSTSSDECYKTYVPLGTQSTSLQMSISAKPSNSDKTTVGTLPLIFYACALNCGAFTAKTQSLCEGTCDKCRWYTAPDRCEAECGTHCDTDTKEECGKTCLLCKWDNVLSTCYKI